MTNSLPTTDHEISAFCRGLLDHDGLMTPLLTDVFGPISAHQMQGTVDGTVFHRMSTVVHAATETPLLSAELVIQVDALPKGMLEALRSSSTPFGALLQDAKINAVSTKRTLHLVDGEHPRWGRRHQIINADSGALICAVNELLSPEDTLSALIERSRTDVAESA